MIRNARPDDFEAVQALYRQLLEYEKTIDNGIHPDFAQSSIGQDYIENITSLRAGHFCVVYEKDDVVLGYASLRDIPHIENAYRADVKVAQIQTLSVDENHRNKGIGRQLIEECVRVSRNNNYTHLKINAMRGNDCANHLYKACDFKERVTSYEMEL